jgi:capsular exopolysaccharide synthesis family protein
MVDSKQQLRILLAASWVLALFALAAGVAAYFSSKTRTPVYSTTALTQILPSSQANGVTLTTDQLLQVTNFYAEVAKTTSIIDAAKAESKFPDAGSVSVFAQADLLVLQFVGKSDVPKRAAAYANAYAKAFVRSVTAQQEAERTATLGPSQKRVEEIRRRLGAIDGTSGEALSLQSELQSLQARITEELITPPDRARVIQPALAPRNPESPKPLRDGLLAFLVALIAGSAFVLARNAVTDRFGSMEEAALELRLPILGELPKSKSDGLEAVEAFRKLRAQAEFSLSAAGNQAHEGSTGARPRQAREHRKVLLVTSPESGAGKSYVTANLARALAADGRQVLALDGDLRRPTLHEQLFVNIEPGVGEALHAGRRDDWELDIQAAPVSQSVTQRGGSLDVLAAGRLAADTAERLSSEPMAQIFESVHEMYDFVVVDSPPVLAIVDAVVLSRYADAVVLVIDPSRSRRRDVRRAVETLRAIDAPILGLVANRTKISSSEYGYYGRLPVQAREAELSS